MRQQKYTQTQQVIDTLRTTGEYATLGDLYHLIDTKSWATKTPNESIYQSEKGTLSLLMATVSNFSKSLISSST